MPFRLFARTEGPGGSAVTPQLTSLTEGGGPAPDGAYSRWMGSSGMKRKGRKHLPKVGTRPSNERMYRDEREEHAHPFSIEPWKRRGTASVVAAIAIVLVVVAGIVALITFT